MNSTVPRTCLSLRNKTFISIVTKQYEKKQMSPQSHSCFTFLWEKPVRSGNQSRQEKSYFYRQHCDYYHGIRDYAEVENTTGEG